MPRGEGEGGTSEIGGRERRVWRSTAHTEVGLGKTGRVDGGLTQAVSRKALAKGASHGASVARLRRLHASLPSPS
ncbi:hypothetical protein BHE74_00029403 [Ensete ventricosum]|nr:hypothetical protein GW17_00050768 [Ensete ventricosum]RWW63416.1 hypothetical protein BHE74_00029403 [Ensete ventricosum]RZR86359.1 hypothetical protein BHM03_00013546 [Ensete ventricosum]